MNIYGEKIKSARLKNTSIRTQKKLSELSGISIAAIANIERGRSHGRFESVQALYKALNLDFDGGDAGQMLEELQNIMGATPISSTAWRCWLALPSRCKQVIQDQVILMYDLHLETFGPTDSRWRAPLPYTTK